MGKPSIMGSKRTRTQNNSVVPPSLFLLFPVIKLVHRHHYRLLLRYPILSCWLWNLDWMTWPLLFLEQVWSRPCQRESSLSSDRMTVRLMRYLKKFSDAFLVRTLETLCFNKSCFIM